MSKRTHIVIPDCQVKDGVDLSYLTCIGNYIAEKKPDTIVQIGDFADMPSLSSYDVGKKSFEGRRYKRDVEVVHEAMKLLTQPIHDEVYRTFVNKKKRWKPNLVLTLGNHENRINRVVESDPKLDGTISVADLGYEAFGWKVIPFLQPVVIDGICYSHYYTTGLLGRPIQTAQTMVNKLHMSAVAGHQQGRQVAYGKKADGSNITCIMAGSCYLHDEDYLTPTNNKHWRGIIVLHEVDNGEFDEMFVSLDFLLKRYA